jgi:hypothetical protein
MIHAYRAALVKHFEEEKESLTNTLAKNSIKTIEDYRYICGIIQGLRIAESLANHTYNVFTEDA